MKRGGLAFGCAVFAAMSASAAIRSVTPVPRADGWWQRRHAEKVELAKAGGAAIVFLGDSITHFWDKYDRGLQVWNRYFTNETYRALNLGFSGDRTEHVLWRIENGELDGYTAKAVVLMIGTNNAGQLPREEESPIDTVLGIRAVIDAVRAKQPKAKVVLHPIFPRGTGPDDPVRRRNEIVNKTIEDFADGRTVVWCDFNDALLAPDGTLPREVMPDLLHPAKYGYRVWANAVLEPLNAILFGDPRATLPSRHAIPADPRKFRTSEPRASYGVDKFCNVWRTSGAWWGPRLRQKQDQIADAKEPFDVVLLGDSITHRWELCAGEAQVALTNAYRTLNLGFAGDCVENLVWRLENGELDGYKAKLFVLTIGTNNAGQTPPDETASGIRKVVDLVLAKHPESTVLLLPVFPRADAEPAKANAAVSATMRGWADGKRLRWLDFNDRLQKPDGSFDHELFKDGVHPGPRGYDVWLEAMKPVLDEVVGEKGKLTAENAEVVVAPDASPVTCFAASEMTNLLSRVLGAAVPLVRVPSGNGRISLIIGDNAWARAAGVDPRKLPRDSYVIKTEANRLYISGVDRSDFSWEQALGANLDCERATLFGVYGWLEDVAGVRFIWPDDELGTIVPRKEAIALVGGTKTVTPDFLQRYPYFWGDSKPRGWPAKWYAGFSPKGMLWMRHRLATSEIPCCHGSCHFQYVQRFGATRPEFLSRMKDGTVQTNLQHYGVSQLCWTNPGLREEMYQDVKAYLTGQKPETRGLEKWGRNCRYGRYVDIMPDDGFRPCFCPDCQKAFAEGRRKYGKQYATEVIWGACREIGNRLIAEKVPGSISMMAYSPYSAVPPFDLPTNVEVMVALRGPWSLVDPKGYAADTRRVADWSKKVGHRVLTWTYPHKYNATMIKGVPCFAPHAWGKYYAAQRDVSFGGFMECESDSSFYNFLNYYAFAHVMWDSRTDVDALLDEAYALMFGAGADEMKAFFALLEEKWTRGVAGHVIDTDVGPQAVPPTQKELWESIYSPAFRVRLDGLLRAASAKVPAGSPEARRIDVMRDEFYTPMGEGLADYEKLKNDVAACVFDIHKGPIDVNMWRVTKKVREVATVRTTFAAKLTKDELVVSVDCMEPEIENVSCPYETSGSDQLWNNDGVEIYLNPSGDRTRLFHFVLSSNGAGSVGYTDIRSGKPETWSMPEGVVWTARHTVKGWTGELRVPQSLLKDIVSSFPANFCRFRQLKGKKAEMIMWNRHTFLFGDLEHFGTMVVGPLD